MKNQIKDSVLVSDYMNGNEMAIEILIKRHNHRIYSFIYSKILERSITDDIFQDTFVKVIRTLKKGAYNEEGKFLPWVMRIAHNLIIDHFRKAKRLPKFQGSDDYFVFSFIGDDELNAESQIIKSQIDSDISFMIQQLPPDQQEVVTMRMYKDMSFKEIAENTGVSINTALGRMRYALFNLRRFIEENNIVLTN